MPRIVEMARVYCVYPGCVVDARWEVYGDDGSAQGEFCKRHAQVFARRLEQEGEVDLYPAFNPADAAPTAAPGATEEAEHACSGAATR